MAGTYMDATGLLATLVRDHPGNHQANDFWMRLLGSGGRLAVSVTALDHLPMPRRRRVQETCAG